MPPMQTPSPIEIPRADLDAVRRFLTSDRDASETAAPSQVSRGQGLVRLSHGISRARRRSNAARTRED